MSGGKKASTRKYFHKNHLIRPREELWEGKGSKIWIFVKLRHHSWWNIWVGSQAIGNTFACGKIPCLTSSPVLSLWNSLSGWKSMVVIVLRTYPAGTTKDQGLWCGWLALDLPIHLLNHWHSMINRLKGFAPIITSKLDSRVWLGGKSKNVQSKMVTLFSLSPPPSLKNLGEDLEQGWAS